MNLKLKKWYISFVEKDRRSFFENIVYGALYPFSLLYAFLIGVRNFLYDKRIFKVYAPKKAFVIGVGNISWAGTGKTPFCLFLYKRLFREFPAAILRRGYGEDENKLIKQKRAVVFSSPRRCDLVRKLAPQHNLFILDDAFQYRKLKKDIEIVIMGARDFSASGRLIPVSFFREPLASLKRADILIVNYKGEADKKKVAGAIGGLRQPPEVYYADYRIKKLEDWEGNRRDLQILGNKRIAAFAAIGYPQGFFQLLKKEGFLLSKEIVYPDHYTLSFPEYRRFEQSLIDSRIDTLVITAKDRYHLPSGEKRIDIFVLDAEIKIDNEEKLMAAVKRKIRKKFV